MLSPYPITSFSVLIWSQSGWKWIPDQDDESRRALWTYDEAGQIVSLLLKANVKAKVEQY